ncbi:MAG: type II toxin-antitoxin system VapC family toxin [Ignavibacteriae bacterium]|nr:type II toxin-antitoxin system VapC family toxin [Ignavibacteriota bacterium]
MWKPSYKSSMATKQKLYLETTIPSYLTSTPSRDLVVAAHQQITREWWEKRREHFDIYISELVLEEAKAGDETAAAKRLDVLKLFPLLEVTNEVNELAKELLITRTIPQKAARDAAHIAYATIHHMNFLMTWNCVHIANAVIIQSVAKICRRYGYELPFICTPEELLGE